MGLLLASLVAGPAVPQQAATPAPAPAVAEAPASEAPATAPVDGVDTAASYRTRTQQIAQLQAGELDPAIDPQTLFGVPLDEADAVAVEAARLQKLVDGYAPEDSDGEIWAARLALDRAQLAFLAAPVDSRTQWLQAHATRQATSTADRALQAVGEAEERARQAQLDRQRALEEADRARTEALRLASEERARLLGLLAQISGQQAVVSSSVAQFSERAERTLGLRRQVRQLTDGPVRPQAADALYDELRAWLRETRALLAQRLAAWPPAPVETTNPGNDLTSNLVDSTETAELLRLRTEVETAASRLEAEQRRVGEQQMRQLHDAMLGLNDDRLSLLDHLSEQRRDLLTGFSDAGFDQAMAELRQVALVVRYHLHRGALWAVGGESGRMSMDRVRAIVGLVFKALLALLVFLWLRRLARNYLEAENARLGTQRARREYSEAFHAVIRVGLHALGPASWLVLVLLAWWLTPATIQVLMESRLLLAMLLWATGGWLGIVVFDAIAEQRSQVLVYPGMRDNDALRMRSLRLVGGLIVAAGVILTITSQIVGSGTVYAWVVALCWLLALPVALLLSAWWREATFALLEGRRRKNRFETWLVGHQSGWRGLIGTALAAAYLFGRGTWSLLASWVGQFDLTRRLLAWVFRRNLDRIGEQREKWRYAPLPPEIRDRFSPSVPTGQLLAVADPDDDEEIPLHERLATATGLVALVGERGSGRTTLLKGFDPKARRVVFVDCPFEGLDALAARLSEAAQVPAAPDLEQLAAGLDALDAAPMIVIDNAHRLAKPLMGGLAQLDALLETARRHANLAWVLSFDRVVWRFFARARPVELLFDRVLELPAWSESRIRQLLAVRSEQAGVKPDYELLLPPDAARLDPASLEDAERDATGSYCRMIWDYADGNPGVALQAWRDSLALAPDGRVVVTPFEAPDMAVFERMPDQGIFVLRAVLQLEGALPADIAAATQSPDREVAEVLSHGLSQGVLRREGNRYSVAWIWYRPLTRFLQRLHLLPRD